MGLRSVYGFHASAKGSSNKALVTPRNDDPWIGKGSDQWDVPTRSSGGTRCPCALVGRRKVTGVSLLPLPIPTTPPMSPMSDAAFVVKDMMY